MAYVIRSCDLLKKEIFDGLYKHFQEAKLPFLVISFLGISFFGDFYERFLGAKLPFLVISFLEISFFGSLYKHFSDSKFKKIPFLEILMAYINRSCDFPKWGLVAYVSRSCDFIKKEIFDGLHKHFLGGKFTEFPFLEISFLGISFFVYLWWLI